MCRSKLIQMQMMDEVINEYTKQFAFVKLKRRTVGQNGQVTNGQPAQPAPPKPSVNNAVKPVEGSTATKEKPVNSVVKEIREQMRNNKDNNFEPYLKDLKE